MKNIKRNVIKIILFICIVTITIIGICIYNSSNALIEVMAYKNIWNVSDILEDKSGSISCYTIYGTHLNISGNILLTTEEYTSGKSAYIVLKNEDEEIKYAVNKTYSNGALKFSLSDNINEGIDLEKVENGSYSILLLITDNVENYKYYKLSNNTDYDNIEYYTLTKNSSNNKIDIFFEENIMCLTCKSVKLPSNVYDITLDAGHGGKDTGAVNGNYYESDITYEVTKLLKEKLEAYGLKVKLTREDEDENPNEYGQEGRAVIPNEVKSKYTFSIHVNSYEDSINYGGVEVYAPSLCNLNFAKSLASSIVNYANTTYSKKNQENEASGVYVKTFTESDIASSNSSAIKYGYEKYNITTNTPYYFMIRETGGIATNAYMDGRNVLYDKNPYYNSNIANETYLIELGYINYANDLKNLVNNVDGYAEGIYQSIINNIN